MTTRERSETHAGCPRCDGKGQIPIGQGLTRACDYYGGRTFLTVEDGEDSPVPPTEAFRGRKELSNSPRAVWQRKREKERSQARRDAIKRLRECEG